MRQDELHEHDEDKIGLNPPIPQDGVSRNHQGKQTFKLTNLFRCTQQLLGNNYFIKISLKVNMTVMVLSRRFHGLLGPVLGRTDFSQIFIVDPPIFSRICRLIFLLIFVGKKCPERSFKKIPSKILQHLHNKNPRRIFVEGPGQDLRFLDCFLKLL